MLPKIARLGLGHAFCRVFLVLIPSLVCHPVLAQDRDRPPLMSANIATRMVVNGQVDNDRLYLFYFNHVLDECDVQSLIIHNLSCSSDPEKAPPQSRATWISPPEFFNRSRFGGEGFSCTRKALGDGKFEFVFRIPAGLEGGHSSHRLIVNVKPYRILEYSGSLSNYRDLSRTIKSASYIPLVSKSAQFWAQEVDLGCSRIWVPAIFPK